MALALQDNNGYNEQEIIVERPDGTRRTALAHANPFFDESGKVIGAVNILVDITERKRDEEALKESDRRKSEFLAMLSHELRNPLAPLRNGMQILRLTRADGEADKPLSIMERQLEQMVHLIDDLLDLSRIANGKIELRKCGMDLVLAVKDAVETSRPLILERRHKLTVGLPPKPVWVDGDRNRLAQVFANLLNNSARYTEPGGHIRLAVEQQGSDVVVSVKDDGAGIPEEKVDAIFEMFTQVDRDLERSQGGLGIGLNLVRGLVEMHGGRVEACSDGPGKGSEFIVRLPVLLSPGKRPRPGEGEGSEKERSSPYRILVVDDNKDGADSLGMMLRIMGHDTHTAYDGVEALKTAEAFRPEVVLLDIGLPKLNGYEVARQIREAPWGESMVLIAQTGWGQEEDKCRSKEAGFNFHMVKPIDPGALEKLLAGLLLTPA
ncbi:MAG: ATP-binding protein [Gemmataceae bacterium]